MKTNPQNGRNVFATMRINDEENAEIKSAVREMHMPRASIMRTAVFEYLKRRAEE